MDETLKQKLIEFVTEGGSSDEMEIVEEGEWLSGGTYESSETVVKYKDKFYEVAQSRSETYSSDYSGSYFTGYSYEDPDAYEVEPKEVTIVYWKSV